MNYCRLSYFWDLLHGRRYINSTISYWRFWRKPKTVIVDKLTKYALFIQTNTMIIENGTTELFLWHVIAQHVFHIRWWKGRFWKEICEKIGMQQALTTAYYSQAVGQMEIMNQTLEISLSTNAGPNWDNWAQNLNILALSYNFMLHTAIGFTPAYLLKGYILVSGLTLIHSPDSLIPVCGEWVRHLKCRWIVNYCVVATDQIKPYMIM